MLKTHPEPIKMFLERYRKVNSWHRFDSLKDDISSQCDQGVTGVLKFKNITDDFCTCFKSICGIVRLLVIKNYACTNANAAVYMYTQKDCKCQSLNMYNNATKRNKHLRLQKIRESVNIGLLSNTHIIVNAAS